MFSLCTIYKNNFESRFFSGGIDVFTGPQLQGCENYQLPKNLIKEIIIIHRGLDAWLGEYIFILLNSGTFYHCDIPGWLDNDGEVRLECSVKKW